MNCGRHLAAASVIAVGFAAAFALHRRAQKQNARSPEAESKDCEEIEQAVQRKVWRVMGGAGSLNRLQLQTEKLCLPTCACGSKHEAGEVQVQVKAIGLNFAVIQKPICLVIARK